MDAQTALDYIRSHPVSEKTKVVLYGQSIGGAVAVDLAANNPDRVDGIILENTFLSMVSQRISSLCSMSSIRAEYSMQGKVAMAAMPIASPYILMGLLKEKWWVSVTAISVHV